MSVGFSHKKKMKIISFGVQQKSLVVYTHSMCTGTGSKQNGGRLTEQASHFHGGKGSDVLM